MERRQGGASSDWESGSKTFQRLYVEKQHVGEKKTNTTLVGIIKVRTFLSSNFLTYMDSIY